MDTECNRRSFLKIVGAAGLMFAFALAGTMAKPNEPNVQKPNVPNALKFVPGQEVRIDVNDKDIGGNYFVVYVPSDYTDEHDWPAIFFFNGVGGGPSTQLFKSITEGKGFIIIGIEYVKTGTGRMTKGQYINNLKHELKSISKILKRASEYFRIDKKRLFLTGFSRGGWHTSALIEHSAKPWAGAAIIAAGRNQFSPPPVDGENLLRGKPIYIGAGEKDENMRAAKKAREFYRRRGADVTFVEYKGIGHMFKADSKILHNWLITNSDVEHTESDRASKQQKVD
jgi:predicted esterase